MRPVVMGMAVVAALGVSACGKRERPRAELAPARTTTLSVNAFLWRAALDTLGFMPLAQVDSNGGVIIGDWYQNPQTPGERVKVSVAILDGELRADAVQVSATRQVQGAGGWVEAPVRAGTVQRLEEVILTRARELRQAASAG